jgi:hypothetical protein
VVAVCQSGSPEEKDVAEGKGKGKGSAKAPPKAPPKKAPAAAGKRGGKGAADASEETGDKGSLALAQSLPLCSALEVINISGSWRCRACCACVLPMLSR